MFLCAWPVTLSRHIKLLICYCYKSAFKLLRLFNLCTLYSMVDLKLWKMKSVMDNEFSLSLASSKTRVTKE